jgi:hypothetical protein
MNSGLITGLIAGPNRLSKAVLSRKQSIPNDEITPALANIGIARAALGSDVTRTSATGTTLTNTGLEALTVNLLPSSRYRLTYRLYLSSNLSGVAGMKYGFTFPASLTKFDASAISVTDVGGTGVEIYSDWASNAYGSGDAIIDVLTAQAGGMIFTAEIKTGSTANTYGDFAIVLAQAFSSAGTVTMSQNSCVEVLKF